MNAREKRIAKRSRTFAQSHCHSATKAHKSAERDWWMKSEETNGKAIERERVRSGKERRREKEQRQKGELQTTEQKKLVGDIQDVLLTLGQRQSRSECAGDGSHPRNLLQLRKGGERKRSISR